MDTLPNFCDEHYSYFMTITFRKAPGTKPVFQLLNTYHMIYYKLKASLDFVGSPELTMNGVIHYHIMFNIKDQIKYHKQTIPFLKYECGFIKVDKIKNLKATKEYIFKDIEKYRQIFKNKILTDIIITHNVKYKKRRVQKIVNTDTNESSITSRRNIQEYFDCKTIV